MSDQFPWYRFYNETGKDLKLKRVCSITKQQKPTVVGVWALLLALASASPERGCLYLAENLPMTIDEIMDECGIDDPAIINALDQVGLIEWEDDVLVICNWHKRQFKSDNSGNRVRKYRQKKKVEKQNSNETPAETDVTLQERYTPGRYSNGVESDTDTDTDTDSTTTKEGQLATFYQQQTKNAPKGITDSHRWEDDCVTILDYAGGDLAKAQLLVSEAIITLDDIEYTHKEPGSLIRTIEGNLSKAKRKRVSTNGSHSKRSNQTVKKQTISEKPWLDISTNELVYPGGHRVSAQAVPAAAS